tara:strand:+ start:1182 stop:1481 length:300 start_codon:yes stop_codon:yes gene_type:complete
MQSPDIASSHTVAEGTTMQVGRTRVYGVYLDSNTVAGNFTIRDGSSSGTIRFRCKTPAQIGGLTINFPHPILCKDGVYTAFTTEHVHAATVFHSGGDNN